MRQYKEKLIVMAKKIGAEVEACKILEYKDYSNKLRDP